MTKQEAIRCTGCTEKELVHLALVMAVQQAKAWRMESEDDADAFDHYDALVNAWQAMADEAKAEMNQ